MIITKNAYQIEKIRESCKLAAKCLFYIKPFVKEGVTTAELDKLLEKYIYDNGAIPACLGYKGYKYATCISVNEVVCHGVPSDYALKNGDIVNIDVTVILPGGEQGFFGDCSRMFAIGEISNKASSLIQTTMECLQIGIEQVRNNNYYGNIGFAIGQYALSKGYYVVENYTGHGVGIAFHEEPFVYHIAYENTGELMKTGNIFTIEPMICETTFETVLSESDGWTVRTKDGCLSAQFEHTILVLDNGYEILTTC